jgi:FkbM family methyltransferase
MMEWLGPMLLGPAKHLRRLVREPEYRAFCALDAALGRAPRFQERRVRVDGLDLVVPDAASFLISFREIFVERTLDFQWGGEEPRILDLGANIGLSVIAFKRAHPRARVTALEPDPRLFEILKRNVHGNGFTDVTLIRGAAWHEAARIPFVPDGADGGRVITRSAGAVERGPAGVQPRAEGSPQALEVEAVSLPELLRRETFDYVKMDIEGAERTVVPACAGLLGGVARIFVEYHGSANERPALASVLRTLEEAAFRIQVHTVRSARHPFFANGAGADFDLILHIYGSRA